jgi:hypothetical protein
MAGEDRQTYTQSVFNVEREPRRPRRSGGSIIEPAREIPVFDEVDVLVIGGGPAGTAAATASARLGARTMLVERYNHLGGLATGGLVIWIDRMTDWDGNLLLRGFCEEVLDRLPEDAILGPERNLWGSRDERHVDYWSNRFSAHHGTVTWAPMIDPERLKIASDDLAREAGADLVMHAWATAPIMEDGRIKGAILHSKQGRHAVLASVVVDTTGDGDIFVGAGEAAEDDIQDGSIHHTMNTAWLFGGLEIPKWLDFKMTEKPAFSAFTALARDRFNQFSLPMPAWRDDVAVFMGPRLSGFSAVDLEDLNQVEHLSRQRMQGLLSFYREHAPGFENAWVMLTGPQIGVRHSRRMRGLSRMTGAEWKAGIRHADEIGVSPSLAPKFAPVSIPYRALVARGVPNLLAAGRHMSSDAQTHTFMREIPQCWVTGHAAGAAAALAANGRVDVADINIVELQAALLKQGAHLRVSDRKKGEN